MGLDGFLKYHPPFMEHLKRHFPKSGIVGSVFTGRFRTPRQVVDYALSAIEPIYRGERLVHIVRFGEDIGLDAIIPLNGIPEGKTISREGRTVKLDAGRPASYTVQVVYGIKRRPTRQMVIIAGPLLDKPKYHGFISIYPGVHAPDFSNKTFWRRYAFIKESKT